MKPEFALVLKGSTRRRCGCANPHTHWLFVWATEPSLERLELRKEGVPIEGEAEIASNFLLFD